MAVFDTPDNEQSFSGLIDQALRVTGRVGALPSAVSYANAAIRECQMTGFFSEDALEETEVAIANPHIYTPTSVLHRAIGTARYSSQDIWPDFKQPGRQQAGQLYYYYAVDNYFAFKGVLVGETIELHNYYFQRRLSYYQRLGNTFNITGGPYADRPAYFDIAANQWMYLLGGVYLSTLGSPTLEAVARASSANWLTSKWYDAILEATKGKLWNAISDDRGKTSFSIYQSYKSDLAKTAYKSEAN